METLPMIPTRTRRQPRRWLLPNLWTLSAVVLLLAACGERSEPVAAGQTTTPAEERVLHVYNWSDYIAADTLAGFERETGIEVTYDVFDSNDVLETRLLAGHSGFDVVVPSASFLERQIRAGVFRELDRSALPNLKYMDADIMARVARHDPGNVYAVPYMWGTTGIGYDAVRARAILGDAPLDSWRYLFDPEQVARFANCGVSVLDASDEMLSVVYAYLGRDPNSQRDEDLPAAEEVLTKIRPFVRKIHSSQYIDDLANGEVCLAVGWSGDVLQARDRAKEAGSQVEIAYAIPREGTVVWFDVLAIPADAPHPQNAHAFINYLMRPDVAAANSNFVNYANANSAAFALVNPQVREDPGIYPTAEIKARLFPSLAYSTAFQRKVNRMWTRFTTAQ